MLKSSFAGLVLNLKSINLPTIRLRHFFKKLVHESRDDHCTTDSMVVVLSDFWAPVVVVPCVAVFRSFGSFGATRADQRPRSDPTRCGIVPLVCLLSACFLSCFVFGQGYPPVRPSWMQQDDSRQGRRHGRWSHIRQSLRHTPAV